MADASVGVLATDDVVCAQDCDGGLSVAGLYGRIGK